MSPENERMVHIARRAGAIGAKVTGAGFGGAMVALVSPNQHDVVDALVGEGFPALPNLIRR